MRGRHLGRGVAGGDLDRDGKTDLVVTHTNEPVAVLRNETASGNWIALHLIGVEGPRAAIGAQVIVSAGGRKQVSVVKGGASYLSTSDRTLQFGLGNAPLVDTIEIQWPTGQFQMFRNIIPGQRLLLREGASAPIRQPFRSGR